MPTPSQPGLSNIYCLYIYMLNILEIKYNTLSWLQTHYRTSTFLRPGGFFHIWSRWHWWVRATKEIFNKDKGRAYYVWSSYMWWSVIRTHTAWRSSHPSDVCNMKQIIYASQYIYDVIRTECVIRLYEQICLGGAIIFGTLSESVQHWTRSKLRDLCEKPKWYLCKFLSQMIIYCVILSSGI